MKKVMIVVAVMFLLGITSVFAGVKEANELYGAKNYVEAQAEFEKALPTLKGSGTVNVQLYIGHCLKAQKKYGEALVEYKKVLTIDGATGSQIVKAQYSIGHCLRDQKKYVEAQAEFVKVLTMEGATAGKIAKAQYYIGHCLRNQKKYPESIEAFKKVIMIEGATGKQIAGALRYIKDISGMENAFVLQLKTQKDEKCRDLLIKKVFTNIEVCKAVVSAMPEDVEVVSALLPNIGKVELKEKAILLTDIWEANVDKIASDTNAKLLVDGVVTSLTQLIGLGENPSIIEARARIAEMK